MTWYFDKPGPPPHDSPVYLWGDWRCTENPRMWIGWCPACGSDDFWIHRNGYDDWRVTCAEGCTFEQIDAGAVVLLEAQRARQRAEREARGSMEASDPFNGIPAEVYIRRLTGQEPRRGFFRCPFHSDSDERTPSLHATGIFWFCHGCRRGGTVYDFGANLWDITPRGDGFKQLQVRLAGALLRVPT